MNIDEALHDFIESHRKTLASLDVLRGKMKEESSNTIQHYIQNDDFDTAQKMIAELNKFTKLNYTANVEEIIGTTQLLLETFKEKKPTIQTDQTHLTAEEKDALELFGTTGIARLQDVSVDITTQTLQSLKQLGLLEEEMVRFGTYATTVMELSEAGKQAFHTHFDKEAVESFKQEMLKPHGDIAKGFFVYDVRNALLSRGFAVGQMEGETMEITKNDVPYHLSFLHQPVEKDTFFHELEEKNVLKNIGFICTDATILEQAKALTETWTKLNESKCRFLSVHLGTIDGIKNSPTTFETLRY